MSEINWQMGLGIIDKSLFSFQQKNQGMSNQL
jgi:hypothetical protein